MDTSRERRHGVHRESPLSLQRLEGVAPLHCGLTSSRIREWVLFPNGGKGARRTTMLQQAKAVQVAHSTSGSFGGSELSLLLGVATTAQQT